MKLKVYKKTKDKNKVNKQVKTKSVFIVALKFCYLFVPYCTYCMLTKCVVYDSLMCFSQNSANKIQLLYEYDVCFDFTAYYC